MKSFFFLLLLLLSIGSVRAQEVHTARAYWVESTREPYRGWTQKQLRGDSLSPQVRTYLSDYATYLSTYFQRLSEAEKEKFQQMKDAWDKELKPADDYKPEEFEWRGRDRVLNAIYGGLYGGAIVYIGGIENAGAAGIPLITAGLWMLGPAIIPKKYEGISESTMRAANSGKFIGLGYGAALGFAITGSADNDSETKTVVALSALGSMAMGEAAFQWQKKGKVTDGHIELMRHYSIVGPLVGLSAVLATNTDNGHVAGASLLAGGVTGLLVGNSMAKKYDYTRGDIDIVSSRAWIGTGLAATIVVEALGNSEDINALILIPAAGTILGTALGQKAVKGLRFTKKQGSTINLVTGGASFIGFGIVALLQSDSPALSIGLPSVAALVGHQIMFHKFKMENLELKLKSDRRREGNFRMAMNFNPENYFVNKRIPVENFSPQTYTGLMSPIFKLRFTF